MEICFRNDYYPSRDRYDPTRWEEDEDYILNTLPNELTDHHSIIRQDYRASVRVGIDNACLDLLPFNNVHECVELDSEFWSSYFLVDNEYTFPEVYFKQHDESGRIILREYLFDLMSLLGCSETYIGFNISSDLKNMPLSKFKRYSYEDYMKGKEVPQFFCDTFDDCYSRLEVLQSMFPEYEVNSISLLGESTLPVKKEGKYFLLDIKSQELAYPYGIDDYQLLNDKLYIASDRKIFLCDLMCKPLAEYKQDDWSSISLWE
jgi:hypothetical protein